MRYLTAADGLSAFELGRRLGRLGGIALGTDGTGLSLTLARTVGCGVALAGGNVMIHDGTTPAAGVWLAERYRLALSVFLSEDGERAALWLRDERGAVEEGGLPQPVCRVGQSGRWDRLVGTDEAYGAQRAEGVDTPGLPVTVLPGSGQRALVIALERMGCEVLTRARSGVPVLRCREGGFALTVRVGTEEFAPKGEDGLDAGVSWCRERYRLISPAKGAPRFG